MIGRNNWHCGDDTCWHGRAICPDFLSTDPERERPQWSVTLYSVQLRRGESGRSGDSGEGGRELSASLSLSLSSLFSIIAIFSSSINRLISPKSRYRGGFRGVREEAAGVMHGHRGEAKEGRTHGICETVLDEWFDLKTVSERLTWPDIPFAPCMA